MSQLESTYGLRNIGEEARPLFAVAPDLTTLFLARAKRLRALAPERDFGPYLGFVAEVAEVQHEVAAMLPLPPLPSADRIENARKNGLPPLSRSELEPSFGAEHAVYALAELLLDRNVPNEARAVSEALIAAPEERQRQLVLGALVDAEPENLAERVLVLAGLQVHYAALAAQLAAGDLKPVADSVCPCCGGAPMSSSVVGWPKAHNSRFCACSLCGTQWNAVRVKCVFCNATGGLSYLAIENRPDTIKAEACETCGRYLKILYQVKNHLLDPLADDLGSLDLDMRLAQEGWKRGGENPFLFGY